MISSKNCVILVAIENELPESLIPDFKVEYTGVGKINATIKTIESIEKYKPEYIINYGSAGSLNSTISGLVEVTTFKQRDMDAKPLGFAIGETPYDEIETISHGNHGLSCGSGDNFVTETPELYTDLVDMESYAIAKVCLINKVSFLCFKFISDSANQSAPDNWSKNMARGQALFRDLLNNL